MLFAKTIWNYSPETEADRLIHTTANTYNRFYLKNGFLVLPRLIEGSAVIIYLPDLNFQKYPSFIKSVSRISLTNIPVTNDPILCRTARNLLEKASIKPDEKSINKLKKNWMQKESAFGQFIGQFFPQTTNQTISLEIRPTSFGSLASFGLPQTFGRSIKIILYLRIDQSVSQIAEAILSSLFNGWLKKEKLYWEENWTENESVIDFLMMRTRLKAIFPDYQPTLKSLRQKQQGKLSLESQKYLKKLRITSEDIFSLKEDQILIDRKIAFDGLTEKEHQLLRLLVKNKNQICSLDTIGDILWQNQDEDSFSLWAIAKQVERLRLKFQMHGLSPSLIQTQRGQGYILRD